MYNRYMRGRECSGTLKVDTRRGGVFKLKLNVHFRHYTKTLTDVLYVMFIETVLSHYFETCSLTVLTVTCVLLKAVLLCIQCNSVSIRFVSLDG